MRYLFADFDETDYLISDIIKVKFINFSKYRIGRPGIYNFFSRVQFDQIIIFNNSDITLTPDF